MTILTQSGRQYVINIDEKTNMLRVDGGPRDLLVTDINNIYIGENAIIKGYLIDPLTQSPMTKLGKFHFTTSRVVKILP